MCLQKYNDIVFTSVGGFTDFDAFEDIFDYRDWRRHNAKYPVIG